MDACILIVCTDEVAWSELEDSAILAATQLLDPSRAEVHPDGSLSSQEARQTDVCPGSGWLMERLLDQCAPLAASGSKSSRQAVSHLRSLLHTHGDGRALALRKRHFDEISTEAGDGEVSTPKAEATGGRSNGRQLVPGVTDLGEQLLERVSGRFQRVLQSSRWSERNGDKHGSSMMESAGMECLELMQMHPSHAAATEASCSEDSINPVQIFENIMHPTSASRSNSIDKTSYQTREDAPAAAADALSATVFPLSAPAARSAASLHSADAGNTSSPFAVNNPHAAARMFDERSSPYLLASASVSHSIGSSPFLMAEPGAESSDSSMPTLSALPPAVGSALASSGQTGGLRFVGSVTT